MFLRCKSHASDSMGKAIYLTIILLALTSVTEPSIRLSNHHMIEIWSEQGDKEPKESIEHTAWEI